MSDSINVLAELERIGYAYEYSSENEIRCLCPFHNDKTPSASINLEKGVFKCHTAGCDKKGDFVSFLAGVGKVPRSVVWQELSKRYTFETSKIINMDVVERYHKRLPEAKPLVKALRDRAVTDKDIRKYRLGVDKNRITIPVFNENGLCVNVRRYLPGAPTKEKMRNTKGCGQTRLYPIEQLKYDTLVLCGGEMKAIVAASQLNRYHIGAITATAGEGNWHPSLTHLFQGKKVFVCMDVDRAGKKAASEHCARLSRVASWVGVLELPLDVDEFPHGDINDFVAKGGRLKSLLKDVEEWKPSFKQELQEGTPERVNLVQATHAKSTGKRIEFKAVITAIHEAPYVVPKKVCVLCEKDQKECALCPVYLDQTDKAEFDVPSEHPSILEMVSAPRSAQREALMRAVGVPLTCRVCDFQPIEYHNTEEIRVSPQLEITNRSAERIMQPAVAIGDGLELNESYKMVGRMYPHPKTQQSTLLVSGYKPVKDALSTYRPNDVEKLGVFQPEKWTVESMSTLVDALYSDFEANVTRIFQRRGLHFIVDLAYHSPLLIPFDGKQDIKGWVEVLVLGDSAQGKSETTINLMRHYGLGAKVECKNATPAGLLGGLQQLGNKWFVTWGIIPTHDKRLVVLEELKGTPVETIAKLTDMRSSGVAEIPKIEKRRTHARTRLVALSNPRSDLQLSNYNFGIEAVKELIGGPEDIRRFDVVLLVGANDIDSSTLNQLQRHRPTIEHRFTGELCRELILWVWTRESKDIHFESDASEAILDSATQLCNEFSETVPIVDKGSMRLKLARLSASLAGRTFSTDDGRKLIIRKVHVDYLTSFLRKTYSSSTFGYADYTTALKMAHELVDPKAVTKHLNETPFPEDFCKQLLYTHKIDIQDIMDWCAWDRVEAMQMLSFLVRKHALMRDGRGYRKTPPFIELLKGLRFEDVQEEFNIGDF